MERLQTSENFFCSVSMKRNVLATSLGSKFMVYRCLKFIGEYPAGYK